MWGPKNGTKEVDFSERYIYITLTYVVSSLENSCTFHYFVSIFNFQGGFAKCYELTDIDNGHIFAGKIVSKQLLVKPHQKDKMAQEISIHRSLKHEHIVGFHSFFEDNNFVYVVLELCKRRVCI